MVVLVTIKSNLENQHVKTQVLLIIVFVHVVFYPLANEVAMGYSNATVRPSFLRPSVRNILVNTLESTSFNGF